MSYTFLPGSTLKIIKDSSMYTINPESFTVNQTFQENNFSMKTLQEQNMVEESLVQKRGTASFSFAYFLSDVLSDDSFVWDWFGLPGASGNKHNINPIMADAPEQSTIYLNTIDGKKVKVEGAVLEELNVECRHDTISKVTVSGSASLVSITDNVSGGGALESSRAGTYLGNNYIVLTQGSTNIEGIINNSLSFRKGIEWLDQPTIHSVQAGEIYVPTIPYQTDLSVSGRFTTVLTDNNINSTIDSLKIQSGKLEVYLESCSITERLDVAQYLVKSMDFKLKPTATGSYIKYNS